MAERGLLHFKDLAKFIEWASKNDIETRPPKGDYQVLQVKSKKGWASIFIKARANEHYTVPDSLRNMIARFYRDKKESEGLIWGVIRE